jgi:hypothetical protein
MLFNESEVCDMKRQEKIVVNVKDEDKLTEGETEMKVPLLIWKF